MGAYGQPPRARCVLLFVCRIHPCAHQRHAPLPLQHAACLAGVQACVQTCLRQRSSCTWGQAAPLAAPATAAPLPLPAAAVRPRPTCVPTSLLLPTLSPCPFWPTAATMVAEQLTNWQMRAGRGRQRRCARATFARVGGSQQLQSLRGLAHGGHHLRPPLQPRIHPALELQALLAACGWPCAEEEVEFGPRRAAASGMPVRGLALVATQALRDGGRE